MTELLNYFATTEFLGILFLVGGVGLFLTPDFYSWFHEDSRHFWLPKLTYADSDTQSFVRTTWILGIVFCIIGSVIVSVNDPRNPEGYGWIFFETIYLLISAWVLRKLILSAVIIISLLWNWAIHGKPLLKKKEIKKGEA